MRDEMKFSYVSLFSGAGIGCFTLKDIGFECLASVEIEARRLEIQRINQKCKDERGYICGDLSQDATKQLLRTILNSKELTLLIATPPCQGMSVANHKKKNEILRNSLVVESIRLTAEFKPQFFIYENVSTFLSTICFNGERTISIQECINEILEKEYYIYTRILNFKNYGANSSRTRTLVIGVRKNLNISPLNLLPSFTEEKTLFEVIGHFKPLRYMGEIDIGDIFHHFRKYDTRMIDWIKDIREGQSAFDNAEAFKRPHQIRNGIIVENQNKNGDKYKRQSWNKVAPCVHTRNDILSSQNTIHPVDNRVFSVREIMEFMNVPNNFRWSNENLESLSLEQKQQFLKQNELHIRRCLGEAVPCVILENIALNFKREIAKKLLSKKELSNIIKTRNIRDFILHNKEKLHFDSIACLVEKIKNNQKQMASYFTPQRICFEMIKDLPDFNVQEKVRILEPSCGIGSFLPQILKKYQDKILEIDCLDIDTDNLEIASMLFGNNPKVKINFINRDFLKYKIEGKYDLIIGNPPFGNIIKDKHIMTYYKSKFNLTTNNIFAFFIKYSLENTNFLYFITPKSLLNAPEFESLRECLDSRKIIKISDHGEAAFDVKIETISFLVDNKIRTSAFQTQVFTQHGFSLEQQNYITQNPFKVWLLYRNEFFDSMMEKLEFNVFSVFRDRQITKDILKDSGKIRVLKSRNIHNNKILNIDSYDKFIDDVQDLVVAKFLNKEKVVLVPNLTYSPRAAFMPKNMIVDGSVAILTSDKDITECHLEYFSTDEFCRFYRIARNYATRTLNIDSSSVKFFGIKKS